MPALRAPGRTPALPGHVTLDYGREDRIQGMLGVNTTTGLVWLHDRHRIDLGDAHDRTANDGRYTVRPKSLERTHPMADLTATSHDDLASVRARLETALSEQGFGVLTEIDVQGVFAKKLDVQHEGHQILGACNPGFAKEALDIDRDVALLLPCPITLREVDGGTEVRVLDPERAFTLAADDARERLAPLAREVRDRLDKALRDAVPAAPTA